MLDYQTFATRKQAMAERISGWPHAYKRLYLPDNPKANKNGNVWVIECYDGKTIKYLRTDGYVR